MGITIKIFIVSAIIILSNSWAAEEHNEGVNVKITQLEERINETKPCATPFFCVTILCPKEMIDFSQIKDWLDISVFSFDDDVEKAQNSKGNVVRYPVVFGLASPPSILSDGKVMIRFLVFGKNITPDIHLKFNFSKSKVAPDDLTITSNNEFSLTLTSKPNASVLPYLSMGMVDYANNMLNYFYDFSTSYDLSEDSLYDVILCRGLLIACQKGRYAAIEEINRLKKIKWGNHSSSTLIDVQILALKRFRESRNDFIFSPEDITEFYLFYKELMRNILSDKLKSVDSVILDLRKTYSAEASLPSRPKKFELP